MCVSGCFSFHVLCLYRSVDGYIIIVQSHTGGAGVAIDWVVQVRVWRDRTLTGETVRRTH